MKNPIQAPMLQEVLAQGWRSVFDAGASLGEALGTGLDVNRIAPLAYRVVSEDPTATRLAPNRIPIYQLPAAQAGRSLLVRMKMSEQLSGTPLLFALVETEQEVQALKDAIDVADEVAEVVLIGRAAPLPDIAARRLVHWQAAITEFVGFLGRASAPSDEYRRAATIAVELDSGIVPVDMTPAIDPSASILDRFELIPSVVTLGETAPSSVLLETLLTSPTASWLPYAAGVPLSRTEPYERGLRPVLNDIGRRGPDGTSTCWIEAEQASGATTLLRTLAFALARQGLPVLVARPDCDGFDFQQLLAFSKSSARVIESHGGRRAGLPLVVCFDVDHMTRAPDFVTGVANGMRKAGQIALILAMRPVLPSASRFGGSTQGPSKTLSPLLANNVTYEEARALGEHIGRCLPAHQRRDSADWDDFLRQSTRYTSEGRQSLFWIALRFWLQRFPGAEQPLRQWLADKVREATQGSDDALGGLAEIACLSAYRIAMPTPLLDAASRAAVATLLANEAQPFGLRQTWSPSCSQFAIAHPLIAEEILRICAGDSSILARIRIGRCSGGFDLQLSLFERILKRPAAGDPRVLPVIEEIVTGALRVDPRESPRNYLAREQVVQLLEQAPDSVFDGSQLFLHQLAKARRHLAADPPASDFWNEPAHVREQLELAEAHLLTAMTDGFPVDEERRDSSLNLHVTLALTFDLRSRFEADQGQEGAAKDYLRRSQVEYAKAQALDPDNTYVLENFARFKLREARAALNSPVSTRLAVEAISLLEWELMVDAEGRRRDAVVLALAEGYSILQADSGIARLAGLAERGDEAAAIAMARLAAFPDRFDANGDVKPDYAAAIERLRQLPSANVTWRSRALLYRLISELTPTDFTRRLEAARELAAMQDFTWPLQMKLEYGVLLYQVGDLADGAREFSELRAMMLDRSGALRVPSEMRFLRDPKTGFVQPVRTSIQVVEVATGGRNYWGIPQGWGANRIPFRPHLFARDRIRVKDDLDCRVQFTQYGPSAVPPTED